MNTETVEVGGTDKVPVEPMPTRVEIKGGFCKKDDTAAERVVEMELLTTDGTEGTPMPAEAGGKFPFSSAMDGKGGATLITE